MSDSSLDSFVSVISDSVIPEPIIPASSSSNPISLGSIAPGSLPLPQGPYIIQPTTLPSLRRSSRPTKPPSYLQD